VYVVIECSFRYTHHLADFFDRQLFLVIEGHRQLPFIFIQRFGSAAAAAPGSGCSQSSLGALFDEIALKLGKGSEDMECKLATSMANMFLTESRSVDPDPLACVVTQIWAIPEQAEMP
jgi:hypothetical protein